MATLPELKARWVFFILLVAFVGSVIPVTVVWPESLESEDLPIPDAVSGLLMYVITGILLYFNTIGKLAGDRFPTGSFPSGRDLVQYMLLAVPLIGIACVGLMLIYLPLSYVHPGFVQSWILDAPPSIWWRSDGDAIFASILNAFVIVLLAPIVEEVTFRGFLLNRWRNKYGAPKAVIFSSILFAVFHVDVIGGFVFGVVLSLIYLRTSSLFGPVIVHITNNLIVLFVTLGEGMVTGEIQKLSLNEFRGYWWIAPVGTVIAVPWLIWFFRLKIGRLQQCGSWQSSMPEQAR